LLIQLPIFIGVYQAVYNLASRQGSLGFSTAFLWIPDLRLTDPIYILPILSIVLQLVVSLMAMPKIQDAQQKMMSQTMLLMPIFFGYVAFTFNAGAVLYWVTGSFLAMIQQYFVTGWGSLSNYLTFLPERQGYLTPVTPPVMAAAADETTGEATTGGTTSNFWAPLAKLQTADPVPVDDATDAAIAAARRQARGKKRR
jgi:YidC/Oxa1 family membrane protein insertase